MINYFHINTYEPLAYSKISKYLFSTLKPIILLNIPIVIICIGSDRSTGDSLGPLIGYKLKNNPNINSSIHFYGSLDYPIHAKNLDSITSKLTSYFNDPYIIAIDSCLGKPNNIGKILIKQEPLLPGIALNKKLSPIGNLSILGIVNIASGFDFLTLQNTRLSIVMDLADTIYKAILDFSSKISAYTN